jgi:hypothetical protein
VNRAAVPATTSSPKDATPPADPPRKRRGRPPKAASSSGAGPTAVKAKVTRPGAGLAGSPEAKRKAALVLEVLGGLRSPTSASVALGISVQRYYMIEVRTLQAVVTALDRKPKVGGQPSPDTTLRRLVTERDRLERELLRALALLRVAQRTAGIPAPEPRTKPSPAAKAAGKRGPRRPTIRARRAAEELRRSAMEEAPSDGAETSTVSATPGATTPTSAAPA